MTYGFLAMRCNQAPPPIRSLVWLSGSNFQTSSFVVNDQAAILDMLVFGGAIFAGTGDEGNLFESTDGAWNPEALTSYTSGSAFDTASAVALNTMFKVQSLVIFSDALLGSGGDIGELQQLSGVTATRPSLLELSGSSFVTASTVIGNEARTLALIEHNSELYACAGGLLLELA